MGPVSLPVVKGMCILAVFLVWQCRKCSAIDLTVYKPASPLLASAFVGANESWFQFPEANSNSNYTMRTVTSRPTFGIAISGGGLRAATTGLGWLRGLNQVSTHLGPPRLEPCARARVVGTIHCLLLPRQHACLIPTQHFSTAE